MNPANRAPMEVPRGRVCATVGCQKLARPNGFFCSDECREQTRRLNGTGSRVSNGGLQVSVGRMLEVLQSEPFFLTERWARDLVGRALSDRQRARFEQDGPRSVLAGQLDLEDAA